MKNKLKRILGVITAISLLLQMSFVITSNAAEYFSLDFESATDGLDVCKCSGRYVNSNR